MIKSLGFILWSPKLEIKKSETPQKGIFKTRHQRNKSQELITIPTNLSNSVAYESLNDLKALK